MAVPSLQKFMLPVLQVAGKAQEPIHRRDLLSPVCDLMGISQEDREVYSAGGRTTRVKDRTSWAKTYLVRAGLLERPTRGYISITDAGRKVLQENLDEITTKYLIENFPEFDNFASKKNTLRPEPVTGNAESADGSPYERIEAAHEDIQNVLRAEILQKIMESEPELLEKLSIKLMNKMGYGEKVTSEHTGRAGDGGVDAIVKEDTLGLGVIHIQTKRYTADSTIQPAAIREFSGTLRGGVNKGVFITTSSFTKGAREEAKLSNGQIILIDGKELAQLMIDHGIGVKDKQKPLRLQEIDESYFEDLEDD